MDNHEILRLLVEVHQMAGATDERLKNIEHAINGNGKVGLLVRVYRLENQAKDWARKHAIQLRVAGMAAACMTAVGGVLGFLTTYGKAFAG